MKKVYLAKVKQCYLLKCHILKAVCQRGHFQKLIFVNESANEMIWILPLLIIFSLIWKWHGAVWQYNFTKICETQKNLFLFSAFFHFLLNIPLSGWIISCFCCCFCSSHHLFPTNENEICDHRHPLILLAPFLIVESFKISKSVVIAPLGQTCFSHWNWNFFHQKQNLESSDGSGPNP